LTIADEPGAWSATGFKVDGGICELGNVRLHLAGRDAGKGLVAWSLRDVAGADLDGLRTTVSDRPPAEDPIMHPNGVTGIDHVVVLTPVLERTTALLQRAGLDLRRIREEPTPAGAPRQAFFRLGDVILEVIQEPEEAIAKAGGADRPAFFWGVALIAPDLGRETRRARRRSPHRGSARPAHRHLEAFRRARAPGGPYDSTQVGRVRPGYRAGCPRRLGVNDPRLGRQCAGGSRFHAKAVATSTRATFRLGSPAG